MTGRPERPVALVTGGNRGLGFEVCRQLAGRGFRVVLGARDAALGCRAARALGDEGLDVGFLLLDVTRQDQVDSLPASLQAGWGGVDVLVNNAGIVPDPGDPFDVRTCSVLQAPVERMREGMETNTWGPLRLCRALVPAMLERGWGRVVNVSSGMGAMHQMGLGWPAYRLSKAALDALTIVLADECRGRGVLVNAMDPGHIRTRLGGDDAPRSAEQGADTATWLATLPDDGPTGGMFFDRARIPW